MMMTPNEVANFLGVPLTTVYAWNHKGTGPRRVRIGRHVRYAKADVDLWLEKQYAETEPVSTGGTA